MVKHLGERLRMLHRGKDNNRGKIQIWLLEMKITMSEMKSMQEELIAHYTLQWIRLNA